MTELSIAEMRMYCEALIRAAQTGIAEPIAIGHSALVDGRRVVEITAETARQYPENSVTRHALTLLSEDFEREFGVAK